MKGEISEKYKVEIEYNRFVLYSINKNLIRAVMRIYKTKKTDTQINCKETSSRNFRKSAATSKAHRNCKGTENRNQFS